MQKKNLERKRTGREGIQEPVPVSVNKIEKKQIIFFCRKKEKQVFKKKINVDICSFQSWADANVFASSRDGILLTRWAKI